MKIKITDALKYGKAFLKWTVLAVIIGLFGGVVGSLFHMCIDWVTEVRIHNTWFIYLLPLGGLAIILAYKLCSKFGKLNTDRVIKSVQENQNIPFILTPLIFFGATVSHLLGASVGREGAALQIGGSIGSSVGSLVRLKTNEKHIVVVAGMASVFSALFGTPVTAAVFAIEVASVGIMHYGSLLPAVVASVTAYFVAGAFGIEPVRFAVGSVDFAGVLPIIQVTAIAILCAVFSIVFCSSVKKVESLGKKYIPNSYIRSAVGGVLVIALTLVLGTTAYNGAGMDVIADALKGNSRYEAFLLKLIFTVISIVAGFKGGEIVPTFFMGSTLGCVVAGLIGFDASVGASLGFVAMFCGVVNCPVASLFLATEVFGTDSIIMFAYVCAVSYALSGNYGLYKSQKILYSKIDDHYIE